ncbi:hydrogenase expression/formation protein HypD [Anaerobacterium chartisolvens]|uniref:Hydrogenase expression/formation protein HypD n=1 Tax=Anaerobacterium chartisolvens TaxID=1297424 RepID=A0A369AXR6_9FIRM|nr:hydrogenase formation protein HypD [Anaerobacterium chartisolvens]RCX12224.1 hydrogenase expression/formation protein HypD [Anaerobacterium chartisolvens]
MKNNILTLLNEFKDSATARDLGRLLASYDKRPVTIMEVCGTHTMSIFKYGIRGLLPPKIRLVSGPGCPVCVTPSYYIDAAVELSRKSDVIIATFGDMMRIPGREGSLMKQRAHGGDIRILYSPLDSIKIASDNPGKKVVFLSVGFETTTPVIALMVLKAREEGIKNLSVLTANKTMPNALKALIQEDAGIDGFIYPGHVSAITGTAFYEELLRTHGIPGIVTGFEPLDILRAVITLSDNISSEKKAVENHYSRVVEKEGNAVARAKMYEVFEPCDAVWRGIGGIEASGLCVKHKYRDFDAWRVFGIKQGESFEPEGCMCGEVLKGKKAPCECPLFGGVCTPESPAGACMVSSEGTCAAYYKYTAL